MGTGIVFDIKEFSINDGPGIRTTVFLKGCPLHCAWCHNPEGINPNPQFNGLSGTVKGEVWTSKDLIKKLKSTVDLFDSFGGGVTFSGGEPTYQYEFLKDCAEGLKGIHLLLDTSGFCEEKKFIDLVKLFDHIYFDLKLADDRAHIKYTGVSNKVILNNLKNVCREDVGVTIRLPMIPNITDTEANLSGIANIIENICLKKTQVHILPYNSFAEGKYSSYGMEYGLKDWYRVNNIENVEQFTSAMRGDGYQVNNYLKKET